jgi:hypothetical protein
MILVILFIFSFISTFIYLIFYAFSDAINHFLEYISRVEVVEEAKADAYARSNDRHSNILVDLTRNITGEDAAESVEYWSQHNMIDGHLKDQSINEHWDLAHLKNSDLTDPIEKKCLSEGKG